MMEKKVLKRGRKRLYSKCMDHKITIRLTDEQFVYLKYLCNEKGISIPRYIRQKLFNM